VLSFLILTHYPITFARFQTQAAPLSCYVSVPKNVSQTAYSFRTGPCSCSAFALHKLFFVIADFQPFASAPKNRTNTFEPNCFRISLPLVPKDSFLLNLCPGFPQLPVSAIVFVLPMPHCWFICCILSVDSSGIVVGLNR
jgi:hypothetical protein